MSPGARSLASVGAPAPASAPAPSEDGWTEPPPPPSDYSFELPVAGTPDKKPSGFGIAAGVLALVGVVIVGLIGFTLLKGGDDKSDEPEVTAEADDLPGEKLTKPTVPADETVDDGWILFHHPGGYWAMEFPSEPTQDDEDVWTAEEEFFSVSTGDWYLDGSPSDPAAELDLIVQDLVGDDGLLMSSKPITFEAFPGEFYPGVDVQINDDRRYTYWIRVVIISDKVYFIEVNGIGDLTDEFARATGTFTIIL